MDLKGKILGYDKKILFLSIVFLLVAGVFFYAGAKYEKYKLAALGLIVDKPGQNTVFFKGFLVKKDEVGFTIKMADNTEKTFPLEQATTFGPRGKGVPQDFYIGHLLVVSGENDQNGNFMVKNIRKSRKSPKIDPPQEDQEGSAAAQ